MAQHPETYVASTGKATAGSTLAYVAWTERWAIGSLTGFGATPLDAIRDLLDAEVKRADACLKTVQP